MESICTLWMKDILENMLCEYLGLETQLFRHMVDEAHLQEHALRERAARNQVL